MIKTVAVRTISDEVSNEVATAILTKQREFKRDPIELLSIVVRVHDTLQELSVRARDGRRERIDRLFGPAK